VIQAIVNGMWGQWGTLYIKEDYAREIGKRRLDSCTWKWNNN